MRAVEPWWPPSFAPNAMRAARCVAPREVGPPNVIRRRFRTRALWLQLCLGVVSASPALAHRTGIASASGKQVLICNGCHYGGVPPEVRFEGPADVPPGTSVAFRFVVKSQSDDQPFAGFNVAASDGLVDVPAGEGAHVVQLDFNPSPEITHSYPKLVDLNREAAWNFTWTAPMTPGTETLYGAGNSVNGDGVPTGDRGAATTLVVRVGEETGSATPGPTPTPTATPLEIPCRGDCRRDGEVSVDELIVGVNIALQRMPLTACEGLDVNGDAMVSVDELVAAIANALGGCGRSDE